MGFDGLVSLQRSQSAITEQAKKAAPVLPEAAFLIVSGLIGLGFFEDFVLIGALDDISPNGLDLVFR